jgi:hypothetical protein
MYACWIAPGLYRYTVPGDYTRIRVLALCKRRTANSAQLLELAIEESPFSVHRPIAAMGTSPAVSREADRVGQQVLTN